MSEHRQTLEMVIVITYPSLRCFGCRVFFAPSGPTDGGAFQMPAELTLTKVPESRTWPPTYAFKLDRELLVAADSAGWRKVTLYGQTIHLCPSCLKNSGAARMATTFLGRMMKPHFSRRPDPQPMDALENAADALVNATPEAGNKLRIFFKLRQELYHCNELMKDMEAGRVEATAPFMQRATRRLARLAEEFAEPEPARPEAE